MIKTVCQTCLFRDEMPDKTYSCWAKKVPFQNDFCDYWWDKDEVFYEVGGRVTDLEVKRQVVMLSRHIKENRNG